MCNGGSVRTLQLISALEAVTPGGILKHEIIFSYIEITKILKVFFEYLELF